MVCTLENSSNISTSSGQLHVVLTNSEQVSIIGLHHLLRQPYHYLYNGAHHGNNSADFSHFSSTSNTVLQRIILHAQIVQNRTIPNSQKNSVDCSSISNVQ